MPPYKYKGWTLYKRQVRLRGSGKLVTVYFFSKRKPKSGTPVSESEFRKLEAAGATIVVNERTGLPFLRLKKKKKKAAPKRKKKARRRRR
ncbi:hypothetical protein DRN94_002660 [archaeon]|nr:hypothetical protein [archaeon]